MNKYILIIFFFYTHLTFAQSTDSPSLLDNFELSNTNPNWSLSQEEYEQINPLQDNSPLLTSNELSYLTSETTRDISPRIICDEVDSGLGIRDGGLSYTVSHGCASGVGAHRRAAYSRVSINEDSINLNLHIPLYGGGPGNITIGQ